MSDNSKTSPVSNNTESSTSSTEPDEQVTINTHQNVSFFEAAGEVLTTWDSTPDPTTAVAGTPDLDLGSFLARPILIEKLSWTDVTSMSYEFNPWAELLAKLSVVEKLKHFALMKSNVRLRFVVNGSPFYYGRLIVGIVPYATSNVPWQILSAATIITEPVTNYLSQNVHGFIDPATNATFEMSVPFLSVKNWARMYSVTGTVVPALFTDIVNLPHVAIREINPLRLGNAGSNPLVNISIFAWFENPELAIPTASTYGVVSEGPKKPKPDREQADSAEGKSTISSIATAFSNSLAMLKSVPVIGPFAMAGSIAAGATSSIAKMFGFSRPVLLSEDSFVVQRAITNLSATQGTFSGYKLSVDPMQGLSVDPRLANCNPSDEMSIAAIASKEAYLTTIGWSVDNVPETSSESLFQCSVTPMLYSSSVDIGLGNYYWEPLPCAFAALPFSYWKGTMVFRFQMVASQYHRGKVAIIFEPNRNALISTGVDFNNHVSAILDLQDIDNFEFTVPWRSDVPMRKNPTLASKLLPYTPNGAGTPFSPIPNVSSEEMNGFFRIVVINELVGATSPCNPVAINVYARCEDLEVAFPRDLTIADLDNGVRVSEGIMSEGPLDAVQIGGFDKDEMALSPALMPDIKTGDNFKVVFGESILSFRSLLKRFVYEAQIFNPGGSNRSVRTTGNIYPQVSFYLMTSTMGTDVSTNTSLTYFSYLKYAYIAVRGGYRRTLLSSSETTKPDYFSVTTTHSSAQTTISRTLVDLQGLHSTVVGTAVNPYITNNSISWETPFYTGARYHIGVAHEGISVDASLYADTDLSGYQVYAIYPNTVPACYQLISCAAADDFSLSGYTGAPPRIVNP